MRSRPEPPPPPSDRLERAHRFQVALNRLRGVRQARVSVERDGVVAQVLVVPERSEADTKRDVEVICRNLNLDLPVHLEVLGARGVRTNPSTRRKLTSLGTRRYGSRFSAHIALELGGDTLLGEVDVPAGSRFERRSVARAVLQGLQRLIPATFQIEDVDVLPFGSKRIAIVSLGSGEDLLVGSALVRTDELEAVARATLDAINRLLEVQDLRLPERD